MMIHSQHAPFVCLSPSLYALSVVTQGTRHPHHQPPAFSGAWRQRLAPCAAVLSGAAGPQHHYLQCVAESTGRPGRGCESLGDKHIMTLQKTLNHDKTVYNFNYVRLNKNRIK